VDRDPLGPLDRLVHGYDLEDPVASHDFLRFGERPVYDGGLPPGEPDAHAVGAGVESGEIQQHTGISQLLVLGESNSS
jgi:hypothetical protein